MKEIIIPKAVKVIINSDEMEFSEEINRIIIQDKKETESTEDIEIEFYCDKDLKHSVECKRKDGIYKTESSKILIAPKSKHEIVMDFSQAKYSYSKVEIPSYTDSMIQELKEHLNVFDEKMYKTLLSEESEKFDSKISVAAVFAMIVQVACFIISKINLKNNYQEEVIGKIEIGDMIGADTVVHHTSSTSGLGVFGMIMMCVCCLSFFVMAALSGTKGSGKSMPICGVFAVITIIGMIIVLVY